MIVTPTVTSPVTTLPVTRVCECCGHPLRSEMEMNGVALFLRGKRRKLFEIVESVGQAGITLEAMHERLYADDINGGPISTNIVSVMLVKINERIAAAGVAIKNVNKSGYFRLVRL